VSFKSLATLAALAFCMLVACNDTSQSSQQDQVNSKVANRHEYLPQHDVEFTNYNERQKIADDPTTILWCTSSFGNPSSPMFTIPVRGKLTSGNKRPWPNSQVRYQDSYSPELPGPDGMYGTSGEYRYGFTPGGQYVDFYNLDTFCTTEPTVWQRQSTTIVTKTDDGLLAAQQQARALLAQGKTAEAQAVLTAAAGGK
jgi:hypothetical protein